ncbi:MAG: C25 family peptidase propeptide domain-containing protein [bacterium]
MKQFILIITIIFCLTNTYGQDWVEFTASESTSPHYNIINTTDTIIEFEVTVSGMFSAAIDSFNRVNIKEHTRLDSVGFPEVPIVSFLLAIPKCDSVFLDIDLQDSTAINDINIYPSPELVPDTIEGGAIALMEEFTYDSSAYQTNAYFPGILAEAIDKGAIRDQNCIRVLMYPVQFNPVTKTVKAFSKCKFTLTFKNPSGKVNTDVGILNEVVGNSLINYQSNGLNASVSCGAGLADTGSVCWVTELPNQKVDSACDYLIITHQSFYTDTAARMEIEKLAKHRAGFNGFDVAMITTTLIEDSVTPSYLDIDEKIKMLIKNTYNEGHAYHTYDGRIAYVNLFGDAFFDDSTDCVPTHLEGYDIYFTRLTYDSIAGDYDPYPDIMIGRCSVDTVTQVQNVVHKILNLKNDAIFDV